MTRLEIINMASIQGGGGPIDKETVASIESEYELFKQDILEERDWLFTLVLAKEFMQITDMSSIKDLGYKYAYRINTPDIIGVRDINIVDRVPEWTHTASQDLLLRYGYSRGDRYSIGTEINAAGGWVYVDGILYADCPVENAIVKVDADETNMPSAVKLLLMYTLAEYIATADKHDFELAARIGAKRKAAHNRAVREWIKRPPIVDNDTQAILDWLTTYYNHARSY